VGNVDNFSIKSFSGESINVSVNGGKIFTVRVNVSPAKDYYGGYLNGIGFPGGVGVNATPLLFSGQITYQYTKAWSF